MGAMNKPTSGFVPENRFIFWNHRGVFPRNISLDSRDPCRWNKNLWESSDKLIFQGQNVGQLMAGTIDQTFSLLLPMQTIVIFSMADIIHEFQNLVDLTSLIDREVFQHWCYTGPQCANLNNLRSHTGWRMSSTSRIFNWFMFPSIKPYWIHFVSAFLNKCALYNYTNVYKFVFRL